MKQDRESLWQGLLGKAQMWVSMSTQQPQDCCFPDGILEVLPLQCSLFLTMKRTKLIILSRDFCGLTMSSDMVPLSFPNLLGDLTPGTCHIPFRDKVFSCATEMVS